MENYFERYQLPVKFALDTAALRAKMLGLSRSYHPDRFVAAGAEAQADALQQMAVINEGYKVLGNEDRRMGYVLRLKGVLEEEEKYTLPPAFLMEMMDLNEVVSDYELSGERSGKEAAGAALREALEAWAAAAAPLLRRFDEGDESEALLLQLKDYYFRKKYLLRIQDRLDNFAS